MENYDFLFDPDGFKKNAPNRRDFLKQIGGSLTIFFLTSGGHANAQRGRDYPEDVNAYLKINADGRITCFTGKIEMGQGIITSLAQMIAEELDVAPTKIDMVMGDTVLCPYDGGTVGSRTTKYFGPALRQAGAKAKSILTKLAADQFKTDINNILLKNGVIFLKPDSSTKISYGDLINGKEIKDIIETDVLPEHFSLHTVSGQPLKRSDSLEKVTGKAKFAGDILLPNMLYAKVLRPPAHGASLKSVNTKVVQKIDRVQLVQDGDFIAVMAENPDSAEHAFSLLEYQFDTPDDPRNNDTIFKVLEEKAASERLVTEQGDIGSGEKTSTGIFNSSFYNHYVAHAPIETHTAIADVKGDKATLWISTQTPFRILPEVAETLGIAVENIQIKTPFVGGGFGGKKSGQYIHNAACLSQKTQRPVQVMLSRKEEFYFDTFRPAAVVQAKSGIDKNGRITFWDFAHLFPGTRSSEPIYNIPHFRVLSKGSNRGESDPHPFGTGAWRGPGSNTNVFAMESQTDIMAQAAAIDPLSFRLKNLTDARMIKVLRAAADQFGEKFSAAPSGKGYGIACTNYLNTYVATIAQIEVNQNNGSVKVKRMVCAQDMGEIINPLGAKQQIEGCLTMGLG